MRNVLSLLASTLVLATAASGVWAQTDKPAEPAAQPAAAAPAAKTKSSNAAPADAKAGNPDLLGMAAEVPEIKCVIKPAMSNQDIANCRRAKQ